MSKFAGLMQRSSVAADRRLSDCWVTIGNSSGIASHLRQPLSEEAVYKDESNLKLRGLFQSPFVSEVDREGYELSVDIENPMPLRGTQNVPLLRRNDRVLVEPDNDDRAAVKLVYGIKSVQPDGKWRVLLKLALMGPACQSEQEFRAFPYTFPFILGGRSYDNCINLDGWHPFMVDGEFVA